MMERHDILASELRAGDKLVEQPEGTIARVVLEDDCIIFYLTQETGGFMLGLNDRLRVERPANTTSD